MPETLLRTKLYIPPLRPNLVPRLRLINQFNQGLQFRHKLTLISAPAGFGKTTLVSECLTDCTRPTAWLSLDEEDNNATRFVVYLVAALQTIEVNIGKGVLTVLHSPQPPPIESLLTTLLNEISSIPNDFILVLDDYHVINAQSVDNALAFLLKHLPPQMHLVIATREDLNLPLAGMRGRDQLTELRAADLRFTPAEATEFLNQAMGLDLSTEDIAALDMRTEGWITGLQLAAISMQGRKDVSSFIQSFTGSHRFVLDYLIEEVLEQQSESIQTFLLQTAVLDQLTGSLCDAVTGQNNGKKTLEMLERANLFIIPLDNARRWYHYHHLFADLLRLRLNQKAASSTIDVEPNINELHRRASIWYEENDLEVEAFHHAAAANDVERAERLIEGDGLPLSFRGVVTPALNWLASLPTTILDASPSLWVTYAMTLLTTGQMTRVEEKLKAAEEILQGIELDKKSRDLIGRIADIRGTMAVGLREAETVIAQSRRALAYLHPDNLTYRTSTIWKLGVAYEWQGDRAAAYQSYTEAISISQASGNIYTHILATVGLANIQLSENQLHLASETYHHSLELVGDLPIPVAVHVHLCLARIFYQWNDLAAAQLHGQQSLQYTQPYKDQYDIYVASELFLARLKLAQGDVEGAVAILAEADQAVRQYNFVHQIPEVAAAKVRTLLYQGNLKAAANLAEKHVLPVSLARVHLAQRKPSAALAILEPLRSEVEEKRWQDERLKVMVLQSVAHHANGEKEEAVRLLDEVLALAKPGSFTRIFIDEGQSMVLLLQEALSRSNFPNYIRQLLAAFPNVPSEKTLSPKSQLLNSELVEPLSERELEVLQLIAEGLTNPEIASRLYLSPNTVKVHTRNIYGKLDAHSRTQAVARARALSILSA